MKNLLIIFNLLLTTVLFSQESKFIETKDGLLHFKTFGSGEPLLIINGGPGLNSDGFIPLAELLSEKYTTILFDQRGTGKSKLKKVDSTTVSMDLMAKDMETIRKHLKIDKWIVLGHSFGGFLAEHYATQYSSAMKAMILSSSGGIDLNILNYFNENIQMRLSQTERDSLSYWNHKIQKGDASYNVRYNKGKILASAYLYDKQYVPKLAKRLTSGVNWEITNLVYKDLFKIGLDFKESLKNFTTPVLIIQGRQDIIGDGTAYEAHLVLKNSSLRFINKSGHYSWLEQSEQYKSEVEKFATSIN